MASRKRKKRRSQRTPSNLSHLPTPPQLDQLVLSEYEITDDTLEDRDIQKLPTAVQERIDELYEFAQSDPGQAISELECLVADYPHIPIFYNHLSVAYVNSGDLERAESLMLETYHRHPSYLFAKTNYAQICFKRGEIEKIPAIFNHKFDLKLLYPHRNRFHITEFLNFASVMCRYFHRIGESETAVLFYQSLKRVAPRHPVTKSAKRALYPPIWVRLLRNWAEKRLVEPADHSKRLDHK